MAAGIAKGLVRVLKLSDETSEEVAILAKRVAEQPKPSYLQRAAPSQGMSGTVDVKAIITTGSRGGKAEATVITPLQTGKVADNSNVLDKAKGLLNGKTGSTLDSANVAKVTTPSKLGTYVKSALIGASTYGVLSVAGGIASQKEGEGQQVVVPGGEGSSTTYNYYTGNEAVDEGLTWLQQQIDELTAAFNALLETLFGGSSTGGTESSAWDFMTYDDGSGATGGVGSIISRILKNPIVLVGSLVVIAAVIVYNQRKSGGKKRGKKGGKK